MILSDISIRRPVFAWMLMFGLIVFGAISFSRLGVSQMPDVDFPQLNLSVDWDGAAPEVMESEIVDRLEQAVISVQNIRDITSHIRQGHADITLEFDLDRNIDSALQEVQANISRVRMPKDVDPPTIRKLNPDDQPIMWLGVSSTDRDLHGLITYVDLHLRDQLQILPGVGEVVLSGFSERNLRLWVDNEKLKKYELTILDLQKAVELEHIESAAGYLDNDKREMNIRVMGEGMSPDQVGDILITQRGGKPIYDTTIRVKDVARVEDGLNDIRRISRIWERTTTKSGEAIMAVGLGIKKQRGANAVEVAKHVRDRVAELNKTLPKDINIQINFDSTNFIDESIHETEFTLILSAIVTGIVCWFFLGSWNSTVNILMSIPTSVIGTFTIMYFMGFTLNFFTLLGLSLAIGIVVDDAIMVLENIVRHLEMGKNRVKASEDGAREITFVAIASSVAIMAIFLPVIFMKGVIGKFFFQFGITISAAVALSLLEAITLTPMRCSQFLSLQEEQGTVAAWSNRLFAKLSEWYQHILRWCLQRRWTVCLSSLAFFVISTAGSLYFLRGEIVPPQDMSMFILDFQTPVGSSMEFTSKKVKEAEKILRSHPEVLRYFVAIGGFVGGESNKGIIFVTMEPMSKRKMGQYELMNLCREQMKSIPDLRVIPMDLSMRGFSPSRGSPIEFNIRGENYQTLKQKGEEIMRKMKESGLATDIDTDYREGMPEVRVWPDREKAAASGVTMDVIGRTVNAAIGGERQGKYSQDGRRYDVRMRLNPNERLKPQDIENLQIRTTYGELLSITNVTRIETVPTLQSISRRQRERSITISANVAPGKSQSEALAMSQKVSKEILPEGYRSFLSGSSQTFKESGQGALFAFLLGLVVAYMVLASQFNSFIHPFTVLLSLPFSLSGAFLALLITRQSINIYSAIGILLLMGIVKKNAILLVEFANKKRKEMNLKSGEAMLVAGPIRLRPILMTSFATLAAAIPPALAIGPGAESRIPMAVTILGGVLVSTLLTLLVVPCAYSLFASLERPMKRDSLPPQSLP